MKNSDLAVTLEMRFDMVLALRFACEVAKQTISNPDYRKALNLSDPSEKTGDAIDELMTILPDMIEGLDALIKEGFDEVNKGKKRTINLARFDA